jgi:DNA replication protein DnaC
MFHESLPPIIRGIQWHNLTAVDDAQISWGHDFVKTFPSGEKRNLYICSAVSGFGKSSIAICILRDLIEAGKFVRGAVFVDTEKFLEDLRQDTGIMGESRIFQRLQILDAFIFDDIGVRTMNQSMAERYYRVLNMAWSLQKHVFYTSKYTIKEFLANNTDVDEKLLGSIASRMVSDCTEIRIHSKIGDFRKNGNKQ